MCRKLFLLTSLVLALALVSNASAALVSRYKFDETTGAIVHDSVGEYDGMLKDNAQWAPGVGVPWVTGNVGCMRLGAGYTPGQSSPGYTWTDRAEVPFGITDSAGSIALWVSLAEDHYWEYYFGIKHSGVGHRLQLATGNRHSGGTGTSYVSAGLGDDWDRVPAVYASSGQPGTYKWHHLVLTWEATGNGNGNFQIYMLMAGEAETSLISSGTYSGLSYLTQPLDIGADGDAHQKGIMGWIDDVHVFNHVLTVSEINPLPGIPEPATIALLGLGGLALLRRRR